MLQLLDLWPKSCSCSAHTCLL
uniref:Uncharacterized protein n=1 Tax=Arundo donax TaxID=35708 RepID=A0A0A9BAI3_ARUDO